MFSWFLAPPDFDNMCFIQVAIHAIGDKANDMVLDVYRSVVSINGIRDRRFRVLY